MQQPLQLLPLLSLTLLLLPLLFPQPWLLRMLQREAPTPLLPIVAPTAAYV